MPRVSIVIPTYNRADLLPFTLQSALQQTCTDREILVIDNASTDETPQMMAQYAGCVRYIRKPVNKGLADSYNLGVRESTGEFVLLLDSDDTIHPETLGKQVSYLDQHPQADLVRTAGFYVDIAGNKIARMRISPSGPGRPMLASLVFGNFEMCGSILYRRVLLDRVGMRDESLPVYGDWEHSLRMALHDCHFGFLPEPLFFYRFHSGNSMRKVQAVEWSSNRILEDFFTNPALPAEIKPMKGEAHAQACLFLAFSYYATASIADAQRCLLRAWREHPRWHMQPNAMLDALLDYSLYMHMADLESFAGMVMDHLPAELQALRAREASWLSHIHLLQAFRQYDRGEIDAGRAHFEKALNADPALVGKRNEFAILLRKFALQAVTDPPAQFIHVVLNNLPAPARLLRNMGNAIAADLELIAAYAVMKEDDRLAAQHLTNALRLQPTLAGRRGVLAPLLRSLIRTVKHPTPARN